MVMYLCLCIPSFQSARQNGPEVCSRRRKGGLGGSTVAGTAMVRTANEPNEEEDLHQKEEGQPFQSGKSNKQRTNEQLPTGSMLLLAKILRQQGFDKGTISLVMDAWRPSTKKTYTTYLRQWITFCVHRKISVFNPKLQQVCTFLRSLADEGLGYRAMNTARSALATILPMFEVYEMGKHPVICWIIKGVYERNPPKVKYMGFWDVNKVFQLIKGWGRNEELILSLRLLTFKVVMVLLLVTSQRGQTILGLGLKGLDMTEDLVFKL